MWRPQNGLFGTATIVACVCLVSCGGAYSVRARREKSAEDALQRLRDIRSAETTFRQRHGRFGTIAELGAEGVLAARPTDNAPAAFRFEFSADPNGYAVAAIPAQRDDRYQYVDMSFFLDESGVIRGAAYGKANGYRVAGRADEPIVQWQQ